MTRRRLKFRSPATSLVPLEATVHFQITAWLKCVLPKPWVSSTLPVGGGGRIRGAQLKRAGLIKGLPDVMLWHPGGDWAGLEIKRPKGGRVSPEQDAFIEWANGRVAVVRSVDDAEAFLRARGVLR